MKLRQHVDGSAVSKEVQHHLPSHFTWIGTDPFGSNPMISGKDVHRLLQRLGKMISSNRYHLRGDVLEHAKASTRLRQHIQMSTRAHKPFFAWRLHRIDLLRDARKAGCVHTVLLASCCIRSIKSG